MSNGEVTVRVFLDNIFTPEEIKKALDDLDVLVKDRLNYKDDDYCIRLSEIGGKVYLSAKRNYEDLFKTENE